ncbi:PRD domain-containing protein [Olsenella sp. DNF00959]|uniref:PRD domain-containing protein n=1 Tax=Olsenella sp. DNF00959 TaxID=1476999 RepID=UPI0007816EDF|nr:PRD domain-containing protein [Olsenella sp. DNF00959]KXB63260.1 PRD domain protein [Olsenella sp. DNF00959]
MFIVSKINNNVAIALDDSGRKLVVFGRGIGFPKTPYELKDSTQIERAFYGIDKSLLPMLVSLSDKVLEASAEIIELAGDRFGELNPNLVLTLADHLQFAISREEGGIHLENPLSTQIGIVYPREVEVGWKGLDVCERCCGIRLPDSEAYTIAVHIVSAEMDQASGAGGMHLVMESTELIEEIVSIVESFAGGVLDHKCYAYTRFITHLRYLVSVLLGDAEPPEGGIDADGMLAMIRKAYPAAYACTERIVEHLRKRSSWECTSEQRLYLAMHVNQFLKAQ